MGDRGDATFPSIFVFILLKIIIIMTIYFIILFNVYCTQNSYK